MLKKYIYKRIFFLLSFFLLIGIHFSFAQNGMNFQGVARSSNGAILASQAIAIRLGILQAAATGAVVYQETKTLTTNAQGVFNLVLGDGTSTSGNTVGNYASINWSAGPYFVKLEMDPAAGNNFTTLGTTQLQYVAYAHFAAGVAADNIVGLVPVARGGTGASNLQSFKESLQLNNVDNTTDLNKPISKSTQTALNNKIDKETDKSLSTNDYTNVEKTKLAAITGTNTGDQDLSGYATTAATTVSLALKEDKSNKSTDSTLGGVNASNILYPSQKAVKAYITANSSSGGVADGGITTIKLADAAVTDAKIATGISKSKVGLGNVENTALSTWTGTNNINTVGTITTGTWSGTSIALAKGGTGATTEAAARTNLGLVIGSDILAYRTFGTAANSNATDFVAANASITGATKTKITYDAKGVVTVGADATTADIAPSTNRNYVTDAQAGVISNTSGTNTGDETTSTIKTKLGITTLSGANTGDQDLGNFLRFNSQYNLFSYNINPDFEINTNGADIINNISIGRNTNFNAYTGASGNIAIGGLNLYNNINGFNNIAIGANKYRHPNLNSYFQDSATMFYNEEGSSNLAIGSTALFKNHYGNYNVAIGQNALYNSNGNKNTAIGVDAGLTTQNQVVVGGSDVLARNDVNNSTAIGFGAKVNASNTIQLGNADVTSVVTSGVITAAGFDGPFTVTSAPKLTTARNINGVAFDGTANINVNTNNSLSFSDAGNGQSSSSSFNGSASRTISYNSIGASPLAGSSSLTTVGTISTGVWSGTAVAVEKGGTGATTASAARTNLGLVIGTNVQAPLVAGTDYLAPTGSAASLTSFPTFNQNTTGNAATATTAGNITATTNTTLSSLSNLATVGTITSGVWSGTAVAVEKGGTGATTASAARTNLGLVIGTNVQAPLVAGTDYLTPTGSAASLTSFPTLNQNTTGNAATATTAGNITATTNTTLSSLSNLATVGTITSGVWSGTAVAVEKGGTGLTSAGNSGNILTSNGTTWVSSASVSAVFLPTVVIGTQQWMRENLDVMTYRNGDVIPEVTDETAWAGLTTGAWCYYNNDPLNGAIYGKLYNWYAVNDPRGLAPQGWHIPTEAEWTTLGSLLGVTDGYGLYWENAGGKMKTPGITRWTTPNTSATNASGFASLPGGYRYFFGPFNMIGNLSYYWSATETDSTNALVRSTSYNNSTLWRFNLNKKYGLSVRCLRDF